MGHLGRRPSVAIRRGGERAARRELGAKFKEPQGADAGDDHAGQDRSVLGGPRTGHTYDYEYTARTVCGLWSGQVRSGHFASLPRQVGTSAAPRWRGKRAKWCAALTTRRHHHPDHPLYMARTCLRVVHHEQTDALRAQPTQPEYVEEYLPTSQTHGDLPHPEQTKKTRLATGLLNFPLAAAAHLTLPRLPAPELPKIVLT